MPDGSQLAEGTHVVPVNDSMPPTSALEPVRFEAWHQEPHEPCPSHATSGLSESPETITMPGIFHGPQDESTVAYHNGMGLHMAGAAVPPSFSLPERDDNFTSVAAYSPAGVQDGLAIQDEGKICMSSSPLTTNRLTSMSDTLPDAEVSISVSESSKASMSGVVRGKHVVQNGRGKKWGGQPGMSSRSRRRHTDASGVPMPEATGAANVIRRPTRTKLPTAKARQDGMDG